MWNYCHYNEHFAGGDRRELTESERYSIFEEKSPITFEISINGLDGDYEIKEFVFDREHGSVFDAWKACSAPSEPSREAIEFLQRKAGPDLKVSSLKEQAKLHHSITIQPHGVTLIEIIKKSTRGNLHPPVYPIKAFTY